MDFGVGDGKPHGTKKLQTEPLIFNRVRQIELAPADQAPRQLEDVRRGGRAARVAGTILGAAVNDGADKQTAVRVERAGG